MVVTIESIVTINGKFYAMGPSRVYMYMYLYSSCATYELPLLLLLPFSLVWSIILCNTGFNANCGQAEADAHFLLQTRIYFISKLPLAPLNESKTRTWRLVRR